MGGVKEREKGREKGRVRTISEGNEIISDGVDIPDVW